MSELVSFDASTSRSLLDALRIESTEAWTMVANVYGPLIEHWANGFVKNSDDAMDVTQNVLVAVIKYAGSFRKENPKDSFRKWLYVITRNESRRILEQRKLGIEDGILYQLPDNAPADPEENELLSQLQRRALVAVKQTVHSRTWDIYWEAIRGNLSNDEIAKRFDTTTGNVRVIRLRITDRIRQLWEMMELSDGKGDKTHGV